MFEKLYTTGEVAKIAVKNLLRRYQMDAGASVHPEGPPMKRGG
jgi:hypothetical protein